METIICTNCRVKFRPKDNGISVLEQHKGKTIRLWRADLLQCPDCGAEVIAGFGETAYDETDLFFEDRIKIAQQDEDRTFIWEV